MGLFDDVPDVKQSGSSTGLFDDVPNATGMFDDVPDVSSSLRPPGPDPWEPERLTDEQLQDPHAVQRYVADRDAIFRGVEDEAKQRERDFKVETPGEALHRTAGDPLLSLAKGVVALPEAAVGLVDIPTLGRYGRFLKDAYGYDPKFTKEFISEYYSPEQKAANEEVTKAKGFVNTIRAMGENPSTIVNTVIESSPSMLGAAGIGRGVLAVAPKVAPFIAGAIGEGAISAGQNAEQLRQDSPEGTLTGKQAMLMATTGIGTGLVSALSGGLSKQLGAGDIDTLLTAGRSTTAAKHGVVRRILESAGIEATEEGIQSAQEKIQNNLASGRPWSEGAVEAAAQGSIAGFVMGGAGGAISSPSQTEQPVFAPPNDQSQRLDPPIEIEATVTPVEAPIQQASKSFRRPVLPPRSQADYDAMIERMNRAPRSVADTLRNEAAPVVETPITPVAAPVPPVVAAPLSELEQLQIQEEGGALNKKQKARLKELRKAAAEVTVIEEPPAPVTQPQTQGPPPPKKPTTVSAPPADAAVTSPEARAAASTMTPDQLRAELDSLTQQIAALPKAKTKEDLDVRAPMMQQASFLREALEIQEKAAKPIVEEVIPVEEAKAKKGRKVLTPAPRVLDTSGTAAFGSAFDSRIPDRPASRSGLKKWWTDNIVKGQGGNAAGESKKTLVLLDNETGTLHEVSVWDNKNKKGGGEYIIDPRTKKKSVSAFDTDTKRGLLQETLSDKVSPRFTPVISLRHETALSGINRTVATEELAALQSDYESKIAAGIEPAPTPPSRPGVEGESTPESQAVKELLNTGKITSDGRKLGGKDVLSKPKMTDSVSPSEADGIYHSIGEPNWETQGDGHEIISNTLPPDAPFLKRLFASVRRRENKIGVVVDQLAEMQQIVEKIYKAYESARGLQYGTDEHKAAVTAGLSRIKFRGSVASESQVSSEETTSEDGGSQSTKDDSSEVPAEPPAVGDDAVEQQAQAGEAQVQDVEPDRIESFLTRAIAATDYNPGQVNEGVLGAPIWIAKGAANAALRITRAAYLKGKDLVAAITAGIESLRALPGFNEQEARVWIEAELQAAPSPSGTTQDNSQAVDLLSDPEVVGEINKALNDGQRRGWVKTKVYNAYDYVLDRMQLTPELRAAAQAETRTLLNEAGFSDAEIEQVGPLFKLRDEAEARGGNGEFPLETAAQNLLTIIQRELAAGRDRAPLIQLLLDSVRVYFGNDSITSISQPTKDALKSYTQGEKSLQGLLLGMSSNASKTVQYVGRNVKDVLRQVYTQRFGEDGSVARILRAAFEAFKLAITPAAIRGALNSEAAVALYRLAGDKSSELPDMVQKALDAPFYSQSELAERFTAILADRVGGLTDTQKAQSVASFNAALKEAFRVGRVNAAGEVEAFLTSSGRRKKRKDKKSVWRIVEQQVSEGKFDPNAALDETARVNGFSELTPEVAAKMKGWVQELQNVRALPESERAKYASNPVALARAEKAYEGFAIQRIVELKRKIETQWARLAIPLNIRTNSANVVQAAYEWASAVLLLKLGFPPRQVVDVTTQALIHGPTRSIMRAWNQIESNRDQNKSSDVPQEITAALIDGFGIQIRSAKQALIAMLATLKGTPRARNVEDLISRIALFERAEQKLQELVAKKDYKQAIPLWLFTQVRWGRTFAAATDNLIRIPAVFQEMRQQALAELRKAGLGRVEAETMADDLVGDINTEWKVAILEAQRLDALAGTNYTPLQIKQAATDIVMKLAYQKMREQNMPADDFEARNNLLGDTLGWNEFEEGGVGGLVAAPLRALSNFGEAFPPAAIISVGLGRFSNAIAIGANFAAASTPLGFFPKAFGVTEIDPKSGIAYDGSSFFRTAEDRRQRKIQASFGSALSVAVISLVASGIAKVFWKPPKDPEERALWLRDHTPNTVEFSSPDGSKVTVPLAMGPLRYAAPAFVGAGAWMDKLDQVARQQTKMDAYADAHGLARGKANGLTLADYISVAVQSSFAALIGGRTAQGLVGSITDYGIPNLNKFVANLVGPILPPIPAWQELARWSNIRIDPKTGTFFDFLVPLKSSKSLQVNMLGDPVGSEDAARRVGLSIGLPYFSGSGQQINPSYAALLNSEYRPPSINPAKAYDIGGTYRPLNSDELQQYTQLRGQYLKENLGDIGSEATEEQARAAYQQANTRALSEVGVTVAQSGSGRSGSTAGSGNVPRGTTTRVTGAGFSGSSLGFGRTSGSGSRLGLGGGTRRIGITAGSLRPSSTGSRSRFTGTRLPRIKAPRVTRVLKPRARTRRASRRNRLRR